MRCDEAVRSEEPQVRGSARAGAAQDVGEGPPAQAAAAAAATGEAALLRACLVLFGRAPVAGAVKTRLVRPPQLGEAAVCALYRAFLADGCAAGRASGIARRRLYVAGSEPGPAGDEAQAFLQALAAEHGFELRAQQGEDLGARMDHALRAELRAGAEAVVLIGSDTPHLPPAYLRQAALRLLDGAQAALGPAADGGYWLVGLRRPCPALFAPGIAWGSSAVLIETLARLRVLRQGGWRVALLPMLQDVDTPEDLRLLWAQLALQDEGEAPLAPHTAAALARLGLSP